MVAGSTFDYVIIGAGSAGCVLAGRLSENPAISVLLIEAGGKDRSVFIQAPGGLLPIMHQGWFQWMHVSVPQKHADGRQMYTPRGKVLGGSSSINGMVYDRGTRSDYDGWRQLGNEGWSYDDVLPYFKKLEDYQSGVDNFHAEGGPVHVSAVHFTGEARWPTPDYRYARGSERDGVHRGERVCLAPSAEVLSSGIDGAALFLCLARCRSVRRDQHGACHEPAGDRRA